MMLPTIDKERLIADFLCLTTGSAESHDERRVADFLTDQLQSIGFSVSEDDAGHKLGGNTGNLYGILSGRVPFCRRIGAGGGTCRCANTGQPIIRSAL